MSRNLTIETPSVFLPLLKPRRYKGAHGGRGSGKSHFFAELLVETAILKPGLRAVCIREVQKTLAQSVYQLIVDKIFKLGVESLFDIKKTEIRTPGGGIIIFRGMQSYNADSIKSLEGFDIALIEEAQTLSAHSLKLLRPTIRKDDSELWFIWNPRAEDDPVEELLRGKNAVPNAIVIEANFDDNPFFPKVLLEEMEIDRERDYESYLHVWKGAYQVNSQARVFSNFKVEEFKTPKGARFYFGVDFGFAKDPTAANRMWISGNNLYIDQEVHEHGVPTEQLPALLAGSDLKSPPRWRNPKGYRGIDEIQNWPLIGDSSRPETIDHLKRNGFPRVESSIKGAGSVEDGVEFLRGFDIIIHPRCVHTAQEFAVYSYKVDKQTEEVLPIIVDAHNHHIDDIRYALEKTRRANRMERKKIKGMH